MLKLSMGQVLAKPLLGMQRISDGSLLPAAIPIKEPQQRIRVHTPSVYSQIRMLDCLGI